MKGNQVTNVYLLEVKKIEQRTYTFKGNVCMKNTGKATALVLSHMLFPIKLTTALPWNWCLEVKWQDAQFPLICTLHTEQSNIHASYSFFHSYLLN